VTAAAAAATAIDEQQYQQKSVLSVVLQTIMSMQVCL
jgi:hypothetical protein